MCLFKQTTAYEMRISDWSSDVCSSTRRRLTIMASDEVGVADPQALAQCIAARQAYEFLGSPEGEYAVAQAIVYVATAPKSNATYLAYHAADRKSTRLNSSH